MTARSWIKLAVCLTAGLYLAPPANSSQWQRAPDLPLSLPLAEKVSTAFVKLHPEQAMVLALNAIRQNRLPEASQLIDALLQSMPNYRLAHLVKGDLLMAQAQPLATFGNAAAPADKLNDLRQEALVRLQRYAAPPSTEAIPANFLQLTPSQHFALIVDASRSRLFVYRNDQGVPRYISDFYVTIGKLGTDKAREGDQRTPLGVYFVTGKMPREQLDKTFGQQADLYGIGAWPLSYPNEWDKRQGRTGHGIWLHGSPADTYSRPPKASNGCVVLTNQDMGSVSDYLLPGTPVVISSSIEWLKREDWEARRTAAQTQLESWRQDWESRNAERYFTHYSNEFSAGNLNFSQWKAQKIQINTSKRWLKVNLADVSLFAYPSSDKDKPMLMADFSQDYKSDNLENRTEKRLYWKSEGKDMKIVFEATAG